MLSCLETPRTKTGFPEGAAISLSPSPVIRHIFKALWDRGLIKACLLTFI